MLFKLNYTVPEMAKHFGCSAKLIYKKLYGLKLKQRDRYTSVDDEELDEKVEVLQQKYPNSGSVVSMFYSSVGWLFVLGLTAL